MEVLITERFTMSRIERAGYAMGRGVVVLLLLLFVCLPNRCLAQTYNDFQYTVAGDAVAITGYTGTNGEVTIPASIPGVGTITSIGDDAFYGCGGLTSVSIPSGVTSIGYDAFHGCSGLTSVTIPSSVTSIGEGAFYGCGGLASVTIPSNVTSIGDYTFHGCGGLTNVTIPSSVTSIGAGAFDFCFGLASVIIPSSVTSIGDNAFYYCSGLTNVTIPSSVTSIGDYAFCDCFGLTSVTIPGSVSSIGAGPFFGCGGLTGITVDVQNTQYSSADGVLFNKDLTTLIQYPGGKGGSYTIPSSVTSIGGSAFEGVLGVCGSLTNVTIPDSVTSIGGFAFSYCSGLTSVTIPSSVTSIGIWAFEGCSGLTSVAIPSSVTSIGNFVFSYCTSLTSITIPSSVTSIGNFTFYCCTGLTGVYFQGNAPTSFGQRVFDEVGSGFSIYYPSTAEGWTTPTWNGYPARPYTLDGVLQVSIVPAGAVSAGAQWQLDGGGWQDSGTTVSGLPTGNHTIGFKTITGWTNPANQTVSVSASSTTTAIGTYAQQPGTIQVIISPVTVVSAGAQWQVDGGAWQNSGMTISGLAPGNHTIGFKTISGWTTPAKRTASLSAKSAALTSVAGTYVQQIGSLTMTLKPAFAVRAGAQWQVDGGNWQKSGAIVSKLAVGTHIVSFKTVDGLNTPSDQEVTIKNNQTANITGNYPNPFMAAAGTYQGLFSVPGDIAPDKAGKITVSITANDTYSAQLLLGGRRYSVSSTVSFSGVISTNVGLKSIPIAVNFQINLANGNVLTGTVAGNGWTANALAYRAGKPGIGAGKYTLLIPGSDDSASYPGGEGYGSLAVHNAGTATLSGTLADGTVIVSAAGVSAQGQWPLYASLYSGRGVILGWLTFSNKLDSDLDGSVNWVKQAQTGRYYSGGFTNQAGVVGSAYALTNGQAFPFSSGQIDFSEGNLPSDFSVPVSVTRNKVTGANKTLALTITPATGLFSGRAVNPNGGKLKTLSFKGAVLQKQNRACGFFLGTNQSGRVELKR